MRRMCRICVALLACVACGSTARAQAAAELEQVLGKMAAFEAQFEQVVTNSFGETLQRSTGRMHLQRPGMLRWEVDEPYPQLLLADGESLWTYDPDLEQATVQPLAEAIDGTPAAFLLDVGGPGAARFHVRRKAGESSEDGEEAHFVLEPRDPSSVLREASLSFTGAGAPAGIAIVDHLNQHTRISFTAATVNPVLESALFEFEVPQGIDVIGDVPRPDPEHPAEN